MPTLLMGHGNILTDQDVILPDNWTMTFLIDEARVMPFSNGVGVVMNIETLKNEGFAVSSQHNGGETIKNHVLGVLTSNQRSWYAQVDPEDGSCKYAGESFADNLRLCEDPGVDGQCAKNPGHVHTCGGILSATFNSTDLVWVSCRYDPEKRKMHPQMTLGSEVEGTAEKTDFVAFANQVEQKLKDDPGGFADYFDELTPEQVAQVMYKQPVRKWSFQREARRFMDGGASEETFYAFVQGQDETDRGLILENKELRAAFERGKKVRTYRDYLDKNGPQNFKLYVNRLEPDNQKLLEAYPDLQSALEVKADAASPEAQNAKFGITVDEIDWGTVKAVSQAAIKDTQDGAKVSFWQLPSGEVLVGESQPDTYRKLVELVRDGGVSPTGKKPNGSITVTKGRAFSKGKLAVSGASNQDKMTKFLNDISDKPVSYT